MKLINPKPRTNPETEFFCGMIKLSYGRKVEAKLKKIADKIGWAKGWPEDDKAFWNAEAFMWRNKIEKEKRELISKKLKELGRGKNLDLGCGSYSYIKSVGFDISEKMLLFNDHLTKMMIGNLEDKFPIQDNSFDSVTAIFVMNYIRNYPQMLFEISRVLKPKGQFVAVLSSRKINDWQRQKEVNDFSAKEWVSVFERAGFLVKQYEKDGLLFFKCQKTYIPRNNIALRR